MKKIISMILIAMLALSFATAGSAITLTSAQVDAVEQVFVMSSEGSEDIIVNAVAEDGVITVEYDSSVLEAATDAQATIIIFDATTNEKPTAGNMIQIDQFEFDPDNTTYTYDYDAKEGQIIIVMMGGTDIQNPGSTTIVLEDELLLGDVLGDGKLDVADAVAVMQYTVNNTDVSEDFLLAADYNQDEKITMLDAIMIAYAAVYLV